MEKTILVGKESLICDKKFLSEKGNKKHKCEKCGDELPPDSPGWKTLCISCYKEANFGKKSLRSVFDRTGESNFALNKKKFDGIEDF